MNDSYVPRDDAGALAWMQTFARAMTENPWSYGLSAADIATIDEVVANYKAAYVVAADPARRTRVTVAERERARVVAERLCRLFAMIIKQNRGITDRTS